MSREILDRQLVEGVIDRRRYDQEIARYETEVEESAGDEDTTDSESPPDGPAPDDE